VLELLPSKCEALILTPVLEEVEGEGKKKEEREEEIDFLKRILCSLS
jgi:hypothetical protein